MLDLVAHSGSEFHWLEMSISWIGVALLRTTTIICSEMTMSDQSIDKLSSRETSCLDAQLYGML